MVQRGSGRASAGPARAGAARRSRTRITHAGAAALAGQPAGRLMLSPTARPGGPCDWPQDRSWLVAPHPHGLPRHPIAECVMRHLDKAGRRACSPAAFPNCWLHCRLFKTFSASFLSS